MKALLIGGTGVISQSITELLVTMGWEVFILNRGNRALPDGAKQLIGDCGDEESLKSAVVTHKFDTVANFRAFNSVDVLRDFNVFKDLTNQYIFISSASAYQKPAVTPYITESTPLVNPYWQYSRDKAAAEDTLMDLHKSYSFPVTIVRPSHTYSVRSVPVAVHGAKGSWQILKRMIEGKKVLIHGDGSSLWTLTHSKDFAKGFCGLMGNVHAIGNAIHITSDESLTWNQVYESIARVLGVPFNPAYAPSTVLASVGKRYGYDFEGALLGDKAASVIFDNNKLKRLVPGYCATIRFDTGVADSIKYLLEHEELQIEDPDFDRFCDEIIDAIEKV